MFIYTPLHFGRQYKLWFISQNKILLLSPHTLFFIWKEEGKLLQDLHLYNINKSKYIPFFILYYRKSLCTFAREGYIKKHTILFFIYENINS